MCTVNLYPLKMPLPAGVPALTATALLVFGSTSRPTAPSDEVGRRVKMTNMGMDTWSSLTHPLYASKLFERISYP